MREPRPYLDIFNQGHALALCSPYIFVNVNNVLKITHVVNKA